MPAWIAQKRSGRSVVQQRLKNNSTGKTSAPRAGASSPVKATVDHNNIPSHWKHQDQLDREHESRQREQQNRNPEDVKGFPGGVRSTNVSESHPVAVFAKTRGTRKRFVADETAVGIDEPETKQQEVTADLGMPADLEPDLVRILRLCSCAMRRRTRLISETPQEKPIVSEPNFLRIDQSTLPIEIFDSREYEDADRMLDEWANDREKAIVPYFSDGNWKWRAAHVESYDPDSKLFRCAGRAWMPCLRQRTPPRTLHYSRCPPRLQGEARQQI